MPSAPATMAGAARGASSRRKEKSQLSQRYTVCNATGAPGCRGSGLHSSGSQGDVGSHRAAIPHPVPGGHAAPPATVDPGDRRVRGYVHPRHGRRRIGSDQPLRGWRSDQPDGRGDRPGGHRDGPDLCPRAALGAAHQPGGDFRLRFPQGVQGGLAPTSRPRWRAPSWPPSSCRPCTGTSPPAAPTRSPAPGGMAVPLHGDRPHRHPGLGHPPHGDGLSQHRAQRRARRRGDGRAARPLRQPINRASMNPARSLVPTS